MKSVTKLSNAAPIETLRTITLGAEPWPSAFCGEPIPAIRVPYPPRIFSQSASSRDYYEPAHGEYYFGFWNDGAITLCQYNKSLDLCLTAEGKSYKPGGKYGGPVWIMPLTVAGTVSEPAEQ